MKIPLARDVERNARLAAAGKPLETSAVAETRVDPARMQKAAEGLLKRGAERVARYFEHHAREPFPDHGSTWSIELATVPAYFGLTALGKELHAADWDKGRLPLLTAPLEKALAERGYAAQFEILPSEDSDGRSLTVKLSVRSDKE